MAAVQQRKLVHKQFNSPMGLYSQQNVKETLHRELKAFGEDGIEVDEDITKPLNLANSAVLRAVEEEEEMKCASRPSRSRQRPLQPNHTPLHQQQLEQIKTHYLTTQQQHDIVINRDTVLRINRLATRRNLHKYRDHSWPPQHECNSVESPATSHVAARSRSSSNDNTVHFDLSVCQRHGIDPIRKRFQSPSYIVEPTAREVRAKRITEQQQNALANKSNINSPLDSRIAMSTSTKNTLTNVGNKRGHISFESDEGATKMAAAQKANERDDWTQLAHTNKYSNAKIDDDDNVIVAENNNEDDGDDDDEVDDGVTDVSTPYFKGFSTPETIAADENIGLVEPRRQYYEQLCQTAKKWHSVENLAAALKTMSHKVPAINKNRQSYSLERGRATQRRQQLPPLKPRASHAIITKINSSATPATKQQQRRSIKVATEIKIIYDNDATTAANNVNTTTNQTRTATNYTANDNRNCMATDLEHIPLPAIPAVVGNNQAVDKLSQAQVALHNGATAVKRQQQQFGKHIADNDESERNLAKKLHSNAEQKTTIIPVTVEPRNDNSSETITSAKNAKRHAREASSTKADCLTTLSVEQIYDDACIYLRSIDLQDNTVAYIPAAITIVPSPTKEMLQRWNEQPQLRSNIRIPDDSEIREQSRAPPPPPPLPKAIELPKFNENLVMPPATLSPTSVKQEYIAYVTNLQYDEKLPSQAQQPENSAQHLPKPFKSIETATIVPEQHTYVTRLPATPHGIQLTRQTSINKRNSAPTTPISSTTAALQSSANNSAMKSEPATSTRTAERRQGIYYTDGEYLFGPFERDPFNSEAVIKPSHQPAAQIIPIQVRQPQNLSLSMERQSLESKYDEIQKSISTHLRQIDEYIANAKLALNRSIERDQPNAVEQPTLPHTESELLRLLAHSPSPILIVETPLQAIVRQIFRTSLETQDGQKIDATATTTTDNITATAQQINSVENVPVVEQALRDLANTSIAMAYHNKVADIKMPAAAANEADAIAATFSSTLTDKFAAVVAPNAVHLQHLAKPQMARHVMIADETNEIENSSNEAEILADVTLSSKLHQKWGHEQQGIVNAANEAVAETSQIEHVSDVVANYEQLSEVKELKQTEAVTHTKSRPFSNLDIASAQTYADSKGTTTSASLPMDNSKDIVSGFITTRQSQANLLGQVIDVLTTQSNQQHSDKQHQPQSSIVAATVKTAAGNCNEDSTQTATNNEQHIGQHNHRHDAEETIEDDVARRNTGGFCPICHSSDVKATWGKITLADQWRLNNLPQLSDDMFDTYRTTYEIPSPYISRQISWEDTIEKDARQKSEVLIGRDVKDEKQQHTVGAQHNDMQSATATKEHRMENSAARCLTENITDVNACNKRAASPQTFTPSNAPIRRFTAALIEPCAPPPRAASPFGLNAVTDEHVCRKSPTPSPPPAPSSRVTTPTPSFRRYPAPLIEPNATCSRAASPFGLNSVATMPEKLSAEPRRTHTPSPQRTVADAGDVIGYTMVPQVEGHNIGLLVRTTIMPNKQRTGDPSHDDDDDDEQHKVVRSMNDNNADVDDELVCFSSALHAERARNRQTANTANVSREQQMRSLSQPPAFEHLAEHFGTPTAMTGASGCVTTSNIDLTSTTYNTAAGQQQSHQQALHPQQHYHHHQHPHADASDLSHEGSVINRSFDNVSPRPYGAIEGYKRVAWPPVSEERIVREFTPQPAAQAPPQGQYPSQQPQYNHQEQQQAAAAPVGVAAAPGTVPATYQPQQQQQPPQQPYPQDYRGGSPGIITLRKETPVSQSPAPVYTSQPAAVNYQGGTNMRGDLKWPPPEYKELAVRENEERRQLALGPVCRPRKIKRDFTQFFAKNALNSSYPAYKTPPGTQHMLA